MIGLIRLSTSFSSTFKKKGRRLIGLYEEGISGGLTRFGNDYNDRELPLKREVG